MLGSARRNKTLSTCEWNGQRAECELCGEVRWCVERCDIVACRTCHAEFLPGERFF